MPLKSEFKLTPIEALPSEGQEFQEWFPYWNADLAPASCGDD